MPDQLREVSPGPSAREVKTVEGHILQVPAAWQLLPPGDAGLSRRVKAAGPCWVVKEKKGRKLFSRGIWAPAERILRIQQELAKEREDPAYARKLASGRARRAQQQVSYEIEFEAAIVAFLHFAPSYHAFAAKMARAITAHAVPVGSGTVARTQRIPIERRAEAAVIAWMRHQTTAYDTMSIPRVKGMRREVRRMLAERSRQVLERYRRGVAPETACPLARALG